jgi:hypothetical protein
MVCHPFSQRFCLVGVYPSFMIVCSRKGDELLKAGKYAEAKKVYFNCAIKVVGSRYRIPGVAGSKEGGVRTDLYTDIDPFDRANLMGCCTGIAKCLVKEGDLESVSSSTRLSSVSDTCHGIGILGIRVAWRSQRVIQEQLFYNRETATWYAQSPQDKGRASYIFFRLDGSPS